MLHRFRYSPSAIISSASADEWANRLILQGMKARMFYDLEAKGRNWHKELPKVLWALWTNINRATRDTPFNLVYGADAVLPPEIYLQSARVAHFGKENQVEARELDSNLLEERCNIAQANVRNYPKCLKKLIRLGFPIFRKVQITIDLGGFATHRSGFKSKEMNTATLAPRILWLST
jgi:hypothetical protein